MRTVPRLLLLLLLASRLSAQTLPSLQSRLKELVAKHHVAPLPFDDAFSEDLFETYLYNLDEEALFFTAPDLKTLDRFRQTLDEEWNAGSTNFFNASVSLYKQRLLAVKSIITDVTAKPFDFSLPDVYRTTDTLPAATEKLLYTRWFLRLKADVLQSLMNIAYNQWQTKKAISRTEVMAKEPEVRARLKTRYLNHLSDLLKSDEALEAHLRSQYLNAYLHCLDPHSDFFDASETQAFKEQMSTEGYGFGFALDENERGEAAISRLAPGSAAWNSGALNKGDVPVQLKWESSTPVDVTGMDVDELYNLLDGHGKEKLELTVRKANGQQQTVVLQKQKLANDDNAVKSFVLSGSRNIGYVMLPSFYTEWEDKGGSRCAADVAREIVKLKKDTIAGLILDLRFNGGGSLGEALELAGIFVDEGVICQVRDKSGKVEALKDMNRGAIYNGPLLVLVNGSSASASEVVAGALQDYHRAIIAGTPTFGKATGQTLLPVQDGASSAVKITDIRLYRPAGKTAQFTGVQPDVLIPDVFGIERRESDDPFALSPDSVAAYKYFRPLPPLSLASLQQKSNARLAASPRFTEARRLAKLQTGFHHRTSVSLKWEDAERELKSIATGGESVLQQPSGAYRVRTGTIDGPLAAAYAKEVADFWRNRLASDLYVEEAFQILSDFIQNH